MNRLYAVEPMPTPTGARADHRLPLRAADIEEFAWALATQLRVGAAGRPRATTPTSTSGLARHRASDLQQNAGASLVIAGEYQPPVVHALAHAMNAKLGNVGKTVFYTDPHRGQPGGPARFARRPGEGPRCGRGGSAADPGRQPGLQRAGGTGHARPPAEGPHARPPQPVRGRNFGGLPVASAGERTTWKPGAMRALSTAR